MQYELKKVADMLLDLGKRNRLLNFKESGKRSLEVINEDMMQVYFDVTAEKGIAVAGIDDTDSSSTPLNLNKKELVCFKKNQDANSILRHIWREDNNNVKERGISLLYLTFGMLKYPFGEETVLAPLCLLAVKIENKNLLRLKALGDEVITNPALCHYLKVNFNFDLAEIAFDENLVDYFLKVKSSLTGFPFSLSKRLTLGIYSFAKVSMYKDLMNNKEIIESNDNVLKLLGGNVKAHDSPKKAAMLVVEADLSQQEAIEAALGGSSFVLQGPPGSGKSQTITNILAGAIYENKKVLFVSEKQAALNVVYHNLLRVGLAEFAVELHSHKANKKDFIDEIYKTAVKDSYKLDSDTEAFLNDKHYYDQFFDDYRQRIGCHIKRLNLTTYELLGKHLTVGKPSLEYKFADLSTKDVASLELELELLKQYERQALEFGLDFRKSNFFGVLKLDYDYLYKGALNDLEYLAAVLENLLAIDEDLKKVLVSYSGNSLVDLRDYRQYLELFCSVEYFLAELFVEVKRNSLVEILNEYFANEKYLNDSKIFHFFKPEIMSLDYEQLLNFLEEHGKFKKFFHLDYYKFKKKFKPYFLLKMDAGVLLKKLKELKVYQTVKIRQAELKELLPFGDYDTKDLKNIYKEAQKLKNLPFDLHIDEEKYFHLKSIFAGILSKINSFEQLDFSYYQSHFSLDIINLKEGDLKFLAQKLRFLAKEFKALTRYNELLKTVDKIKSLNLYDYLEKVMNANLPLKQVAANYEANFYQENYLYEYCNQGLYETVGDKLAKFKKLNRQALLINQALIKERISAKRSGTSFAADSSMAQIDHENKKQRRQKAIRTLLKEHFDFITEIKPIFLMSPLSVSTYLPAVDGLFDLVIFDEASQVYAWDALGAIYRGKQCIVIGDSKQLPPSAFFMSVNDDQYDEENSYELESILTRAALCFNTKRLRWHYRSRSEELIAFSNKYYYEDQLITIPQAKKHVWGFGIDVFHVENGRYENNLNYLEAKAIVNMVFKHFEENPKKSLGVIALSLNQAELIKDLIDERLATATEYAKFFNETSDEAFFVKNLEMVQGDERDCIIVSLGYAKNDKGKLNLHFGPLNKDGGENRLNVAITRAKYNLCLVCSFKSSDINLENSKSLGIKYLKSYLEYAENLVKESADLPLENVLNQDLMVEALTKFLDEQGIATEKFIGRSAFKVDIAVKHPLTGEYYVAVMLDGKSYQIGSISDANRLQEEQLKRLGWQFYRLFSPDWLRPASEVGKDLLNFIHSALANELKTTEEILEKPQLVTLSKDDKMYFANYNFVSDLEIRKLFGKMSTKKILSYIIEKEQPIHKEYLLKRVCLIYGYSKVSSSVRQLFAIDLAKINVFEDQEFLSVSSIEEYKLRQGGHRPLEYIHDKELEDGIVEIVKNNIGITKESCFKTLIEVLGYERLTEVARLRFEPLLTELLVSKTIEQRENRLYFI